MTVGVAVGVCVVVDEAVGVAVGDGVGVRVGVGVTPTPVRKLTCQPHNGAVVGASQALGAGQSDWP